ncbi:MAG: hypothetical protein RL571_2051 [Pseudomonadota bacterium]|jgi:hypothetical protein
MEIHSLGGKRLNQEERSTGLGDALASAQAHLVFNAHAKYTEADALKTLLQGLQDTGQAPLLDMLGVDPTPPASQANCVNAEVETDSSADLGIALPLSWAPNLTVALDSLSLHGLPQAKLLDVERLHRTPQSMRKVSRLQEQEQEERGVSSLFPFSPIINQRSEPAEVSMSVGEGGGDFVAALSTVSAPARHLAGTDESRDAGPAFNVTMSEAYSLPSSVGFGLESKGIAAAEHFAGMQPLSLAADVGQVNTAKPDVPSQVNTAVLVEPNSSRLKLAGRGAQSELAMLAPTPVGEQTVGPLVLARGAKVSAVRPVFVGNESASELPASTSQAGQLERSVRAQELVTSALLPMLSEPNLNGPHSEFVSHPAPRSMPAPVLQVLPSPVEQQGLTYHFKSWGSGAFVSVNTLSAGDVRFVPSDVQVLHALQTYGEDHDMPQHWRVEANERRDDEVPRRQARALLIDEENEE